MSQEAWVRRVIAVACVGAVSGCGVTGTQPSVDGQGATTSVTAAPSGSSPQLPGYVSDVTAGIAVAGSADQPQACAFLNAADVEELTEHDGVARNLPSIPTLGKSTVGRDNTIIQQCRYDTDVSTLTYELAVFPGPAAPVLKAEREDLPMSSSFLVGVGEYSLGTVFATPVLNASRVDAAVANYVVTVTSDHPEPARAQHEVTVVGKRIVKRLQTQLENAE